MAKLEHFTKTVKHLQRKLLCLNRGVVIGEGEQNPYIKAPPSHPSLWHLALHLCRMQERGALMLEVTFLHLIFPHGSIRLAPRRGCG